jgi:hypothetical protein
VLEEVFIQFKILGINDEQRQLEIIQNILTALNSRIPTKGYYYPPDH